MGDVLGWAQRRREKPSQKLYGVDPRFYKRVVKGGFTHPTNGFFGIK